VSSLQARKVSYPQMLHYSLAISYTHDSADRFYSNITDWLHAPAFREELEESQSLLEEGTAQWLFENHRFVEWKASQSVDDSHNIFGNCLWVKGFLILSRIHTTK